MTIKHMQKNISAENITTLFDINVQRNNNNEISSITLTRKNFHGDVLDTSHDLLDYFYTKKQINDRIKVHLKIYQTKAALDSANDDDAKQENYIYLVPYSNSGDHNEGIYKEYIYIASDDSYEEVGSTELDLQPIINRISAMESGKQDKSNITTSWGNSPSDSKYPSEKLVKDTFNSLNNNFVETSDVDEIPLEFTYEGESSSETIYFLIRPTVNNGD